MSPTFTVTELWATVPVFLSDVLHNLPEVNRRQITIGFFGRTNLLRLRDGYDFTTTLSVFVVSLTLYRLILWPFILSPLRKIAGPPVGNLIFGQPRTLNSPLHTWAKQYGPIFRMIGTFGTEVLVVLKPEVLHQVLVKDWDQYPRVGV
jgi:hypothetical protein